MLTTELTIVLKSDVEDEEVCVPVNHELAVGTVVVVVKRFKRADSPVA